MIEKDIEKLGETVESDHEMILLLKTEIEKLTTQLATSEESHSETSEQLSIHEKLSAQHALLRHIFSGVIVLVICMSELLSSL